MKYTLKIICSKSQLRDIRSFTEKILREHQMDELERSSVVLAIDEVCANLIIHGHHEQSRDELKLQIDVKPSKVVFDIMDTSAIFDINNYETPQLEDIIRKQRKGGLGLMLVKKIMDDIKIFSRGKYNVCQLTKFREEQ